MSTEQDETAFVERVRALYEEYDYGVLDGSAVVPESRMRDLERLMCAQVPTLLRLATEALSGRAVIAAAKARRHQYRPGCICPECALSAALIDYDAARQHQGGPGAGECTMMPQEQAPEDWHTSTTAVRQALQRMRKARGLTQNQLGALLDPPVSHAAISDIERGATALTLDYLTALCAALGTIWTLVLPE